MTLSHHRAGAGEPLVLLHGIGSSRRVWDPVLATLAAERDVVAVDLPGFGESAPLPPGTEPSPAALADTVAALLDELGFQTAHVAGNSLGGWVGLELAKRARTRSVCALSPAGFWNRRESAFARSSLELARAAARLVDGRLEGAIRSAPVRRVAFAQLVARGDRIPPDDALRALRDLASCPGWDATLAAMSARRFETRPDEIRCPVTIAWAEHDRLLLPRQHARARARLPAARHLTLPGCGHVPTWDDPGVVAAAVLSSA